MRGARLAVKDNIEKTILDFLGRAIGKNLFDAILIPVIVPAGDSYAWVLAQDRSLLDDASPLPPVMPVQGAKAISSVTKRGKGDKKIAAIMRPCETRAVIELSKLKQVELENIFLITIDCPGVLPLSDYLNDPGKGEDEFKKVIKEWGNEKVRPVCQICSSFSAPGGEDLHLGILGTKEESILFIPGSPAGEKILGQLDISLKDDISDWEARVKKIGQERRENRRQVQEGLSSKVVGLDKLLDTFSKCINCHNCQSVCPICYCRQCYFESEKMKLPSDDYLMRAESKGAFRFLPDTLLFHLGRMTHMSLSCVGCGMCEDACPMSIKVAQIFSIVADRSQKVFNYVPGKSIEEPLPLKVYEEDEFHEVEKP